jgi:predicted metal-binding membrane protein
MLRWRPEWPYLVLVMVARVALLASAGGHVGGPSASHDPGHPELAAASHDHHHSEPAAAVTLTQRDEHSSGSLPAALAGWTLMSVAMMGPVALPAVRYVGLNSLRQRRQWAMFVFSAVYVGIWAAFGILALGWQRLALGTMGIDACVLLIGTLVVASGWQLTRVKRRALLTCRRTVPLPLSAGGLMRAVPASPSARAAAAWPRAGRSWPSWSPSNKPPRSGCSP